MTRGSRQFEKQFADFFAPLLVVLHSVGKSDL